MVSICRLSAAFLFFSLSAFSQLSVNAGRDTTLCTPYSSFILGGNPTSSGGQPPYIFKWYCRYFSGGYWRTETFFLDDPAAANPLFKGTYSINQPINGTVLFILKVTDSNQISVNDTIKITISSISFVTTRNLEACINAGDSVKIEAANIVNGIPPFKYLWEPSDGLSDPKVKSPWASPLQTTFYMGYVSDSVGCRNNEPFPVFVNPTYTENEIADLTSFVYPNPVVDKSIISLKPECPDNLVIEVYNLNGTKIHSDFFYQDYAIGAWVKKNGTFIYKILHCDESVLTGKIIRK